MIDCPCSVLILVLWAVGSTVELLLGEVPWVVPVLGEPGAVGLADSALPPWLGPVGTLADVEGASGPLASGTPWEGAVATDVPGFRCALLALALGTLLLLPVANIVPDLGLGAVGTHRCRIVNGTRMPGVVACWVVGRLVPV